MPTEINGQGTSKGVAPSGSTKNYYDRGEECDLPANFGSMNLDEKRVHLRERAECQKRQREKELLENPPPPEDTNTGENEAEAEGGETNVPKNTKELYTYDRDIKAEKFGDDAIQKIGAPSLFNPFAVFTHPRANTYNDFLDKKGGNKVFPKFENQTAGGGGTGGRNLTVKSLISDFDPDGTGSSSFSKGGSAPYYASDFLYARYYNRIPLNRLITVRRYPFPTYDNLDFIGEGNNFKPIAQAITYFGEPTGNDIKELTKWTGQIEWEELTADVHDVEGNEQGFDQSPLGGTGNIGKAATAIFGSKNDLSQRRAAELEGARKYNNFEYTNKVIGPVNVVNKTNVRKRGIGSKKEFNIVFEYELKSYNQINPRLAMLDILCNMLALTFNNAKFWGGANRYFPKSPQFGFAGDQKAFYEGRYGDYLNDLIPQITTGAGDALSKLTSLVSSLLKLDFSGLGDIAKNVGSKVLDLKSAKSRPQVLGFHALLSGLPVGEWHMTVGNPYRPIMSIGNLICKGFEFEFSEHLGADDFPSMLKFIVNLETGRPRDKGDLESIFQFGEGRMYYPPEGLIDVSNTSASTQNSQGGVNDPAKNGAINAQSTNNPLAFNRAGADHEYTKKLIGTAY